MKNKIRFISVLIALVLTLNISSSVLAVNDTGKSELTLTLSEDFKNWNNLSEEEKSKVIMPIASANNITEKDENRANSFFYGIQNFFTKASIPSEYNLTEDINIPVKHQGSTGECWAFSMTSVLESYLALSQPGEIIPRYSARHMDYATSKTFLDGINTKGYNREVGSGGNSGVALGYLTNGTGAVLEKDMPFEDNEDKINLSEIQNKQPDIRVTDAKVFPSINKNIDEEGNVTYINDSNQEYTEEEVSLLRNEIKQYIMQYGALSTNTVANNSDYYSNPEDPMHSAAYFCNNNLYSVDHAITIIGWDDNYSVDNFNPENKPKNPGAYICLNSYGTESFADGYTYVSYDDVNVEKDLTGIMGTEKISDDKTIYQNDFYGATIYLSVNPQGSVGMANVFSKEGTEDEYIEQIQVAASGNVTAEVYINPSDESLDDSKMQKVELDSSSLDGSYNTLKLQNPVKITGDKFAVAVKLSANERFMIGIECNYADSGLMESPVVTDPITANQGESYISLNSLQSWDDFTKLKLSDGTTFEQSNLCVKAITTKNVSSEPEQPNTNTNNDNQNTNTNTNNNNQNTNTNTNTNNNNQNTNTNTNTNNNNQNTNTNTNTNNNNQNTNTNTDNNNQNTNTNTNNNNQNTNTNTNNNNQNTNTNTDNNNQNTNTNTDNNNQNTNTNTNNNNQNTNTNTNNNNQNTNTNTNNNNQNTNTNTNNNNQNTNTNTDNNNQNTNTNNNNNNQNTNNNSNSGAGTTNSNNNSNSNSAYYYNGTVDKTLADELLPKTGTDMARWVLPIVVVIFIISYFNYRRYRDIKIK